MAYNNNYFYGRCILFWHAGSMRLITRKESIAVVEIPAYLIDCTCKDCTAFHIKGMCNTGCGNTADHFPHS